MDRSIDVNEEVAKLYNTFPRHEQAKLQALLTFWMEEIRTGNQKSLSEIMDEISTEAEKRGLTPEILDQLLADES